MAIAAIFWSWDRVFGLPLGCETTAYPARCNGTVVGNRCHGDLAEALPRRRFVVEPAAARVTEIGPPSSGAPPRCRVTDCRQWECMDEIFVRTLRDGEFREQLRPGLTPVDPMRGLTVVYVPAWQWWPRYARALVGRALSELLSR